MKTLIVTASSKTKNKENLDFSTADFSFTDCLAQNYKQQLLSARHSLLHDFGFSEGPDTHPNIKSTEGTIYLPAFRRYKGRTFSKVSQEAWKTLIQEKNLDCVILSAYYGIVRYNEFIRNYEIKQVTKMIDGKPIGRFWKEQGAHDWLFDYVKNNKFDDVKFVLSTSYSDIIKKTTLMNRLKNELDINNEDKQFKQGGMKSMLLRGQYINDFLLNY